MKLLVGIIILVLAYAANSYHPIAGCLVFIGGFWLLGSSNESISS